MSAAIKVRFTVEVELSTGTQMTDACEIAEHVTAKLIQNREVADAQLVTIERVDSKSRTE